MRLPKVLIMAGLLICLTAPAWAAGEAGTALKADDIKAEPFRDAKVVGSPVGSRLIDLCVNGDSAMRAQPNCHEKLLLFNNAHSKSFQLKFDGHRGKAETTVIVKKGEYGAAMFTSSDHVVSPCPYVRASPSAVSIVRR